MAKLPTGLSGRRVSAALERAGFVFVRQKGSHMILHSGSVWVVVPDHRTVKPRHAQGHHRRCRPDVDEFIGLLK